MRRTASKNKSLRLAISYGFLSGKRHAKQFICLAEQAGFIMSSIDSADIVLAHSAGCLIMPKSAKPQLVFYIGMPLTSARLSQSWLGANVASFRYGRFRGNLRIRLLNCYYVVREGRRNLYIFLHPKIARPVVYKQAESVFISNRHDPWPRAKKLDALLAGTAWAFIGMPGAHDHIWEQPADYIAIIKHYARLLA